MEKSKNEHFIVRQLEKGAIMGYESFFGAVPAEYSAKSVIMCHLVYCTRDVFTTILHRYEEEYERFCAMRDSLLFMNKKIDSKCASCFSFEH